MDLQTQIALALVFLFCIFLFYKKKNIEIQKLISYGFYIILLRGKYGIEKMEDVAKRYPRLVKTFGIISIIIAYLGIIFITIALVGNVIDLLTKPDAVSGVGLVLPVKAKGIFYVPPLFFILTVFSLAIIHEFSHGLLARRYDIPIKSSGFGFLSIFLPLLPFAFVEPDEKKLAKSKPFHQLSVLAAGPGSNVMVGLVIALLLNFVLAPIPNMIFNNGVVISSVNNDSSLPAYSAGITFDELILSVDDLDSPGINEFNEYMSGKGPGDEVTIVTNVSSYDLVLSQHPDDPKRGYIGIMLSPWNEYDEDFVKKYGYYTPRMIWWFLDLLFWMVLVHIGVGTFNLIPLGPLDGGRITLITLKTFFRKETAEKIFKGISMFFLFILFVFLYFFARQYF